MPKQPKNRIVKLSGNEESMGCPFRTVAEVIVQVLGRNPTFAVEFRCEKCKFYNKTLKKCGWEAFNEFTEEPKPIEKSEPTQNHKETQESPSN